MSHMQEHVTPHIQKADFDNPVDRAGIIEALDSYASDPMGGGKPLSEEVRERLVPLLRDHSSALVLLAFVEERPVGVAVCFLGLSTFQARPLLNIHDLAVLPPFRGRGIGRALLAEAEKQAVGHGCCKLTLEVRDDNPARTLYERAGFSAPGPSDAIAWRFLCKPLG